MAGSLALVSFLIALACSSAQITEPQPTALDLSIYQQQTALQLPAGTARGGLDLTPAPRDVVGSQACLGVPVSSYVTWTCIPGALQCSGTCISGTRAPYGPPVAVCTGGKWVISRTCMAGGIYGFDDVTVDGSLPGNFLGLKWSGLRVTNSQRFTACDGYSGFRHGVVSGPNVAYSLEVGAAGDLTNLVRITAPQPDKKFSVLGFAATAAWQDGLRIDVAGWDAQNNQVALQLFRLAFLKRTDIDLRSNPAFSGIYRLTIITSGGAKASCQTGLQVVLDNMEIYLHGD